MKQTRLRWLAAGSILVVAVGVLAACTPTAAPGGSAPSGPPLKIGVVLSFTGPLANNASTNMNGIEYYFGTVNNQVAGRPIQLIKKDDKSTPSDALNVTRELVEQDRVDAIIGYINSAAALAVRDYIHTNKMLTLITTAGANEVTQAQASPYIFRTANDNEQEPVAMGPWAYQQGYRNIVTIGSDYAAGHEMADAFKWSFEKQGGRVINQIYTPLTQTDFAPNLTAIQQSVGQADAVWGFVVGAGQIQFVKQYEQFGLKDRLPLMGQGGITSENLMPQIGDSAIGVISGKNFATKFAEGQGTRALQTALDDWRSQYATKFNEPATAWTLQAYLASQAYWKAVQDLNGQTSNPDQVAAAIAKVQMEGPLGIWTFDDKHQAVFPVYIRRVEKMNGELETVAIATIPNVGQTLIPSQ